MRRILTILLLVGSSTLFGQGMNVMHTAQRSTYATPSAGGGSALLTNLESWWTLDEASGDAIDSHGSNDLTNYGATQGATGQVGDAYSMTTGDYVGQLDGLELTEFSMAFWINTTTTNYAACVGNWYWTNQGYYAMVTEDFGHVGAIEFRVRNGSADLQLYSTTLVNDGSWHFVVCTYDGTTAKLYIDGNTTPEASNTISAPTFDADSRFSIGDRAGLTGLTRSIDEVGIWSADIGTAGVTELWNSGSGITYGDL